MGGLMETYLVIGEERFYSRKCRSICPSTKCCRRHGAARGCDQTRYCRPLRSTVLALTWSLQRPLNKRLSRDDMVGLEEADRLSCEAKG